MQNQQMIEIAVQILLIAAAVNWGLVAHNNTDLVKMATGGGDLEKYAKYAIAAAGLYGAYMLYEKYA